MITFFTTLIAIFSIVSTIRLFKRLDHNVAQRSLRLTFFLIITIFLFVILKENLFPYTPSPIDTDRWTEITGARQQSYIDKKNITLIDDDTYQYAVLTNYSKPNFSSSLRTYTLNCKTKAYKCSVQYISYSEQNAYGKAKQEDFRDQLPPVLAQSLTYLTFTFNVEEKGQAFIFNFLCISDFNTKYPQNINTHAQTPLKSKLLKSHKNPIPGYGKNPFFMH